MSGYRNSISPIQTTEQIDAVGQGRIWAGGTARQLGLVDRLGDMDEAIAEAAKLAKLEEGDWHVKYYDHAPDEWAALLSGFGMGQAKQYGSLDLFARVSVRQNLAIEALWNDLFGLTKVQGVQVQCLDCMTLSGISPRPNAVKPSQMQLWHSALSR